MTVLWWASPPSDPDPASISDMNDISEQQSLYVM